MNSVMNGLLLRVVSRARSVRSFPLLLPFLFQDPDQLKEREADVRQGKAHQTHQPRVFVDLGDAADRHAGWTTVMASTGGGGSHRAGGPEFGTGLTDH